MKQNPKWQMGKGLSACRGALRDGLLALLILSLLAAPAKAANGGAINAAAARKVSDAFMADLRMSKLDDALDLMEPEYLRELGRPEAEAKMRKFFDYCGQPVTNQLVDQESDVKTYPDGHKSPTRRFYYSGDTTKYKNGNCWFSVNVVATPSGLRVSDYGAVHQFAGVI